MHNILLVDDTIKKIYSKKFKKLIKSTLKIKSDTFFRQVVLLLQMW